MKKFLTGNFNNEPQMYRGWIVGHFMERDSPFFNQDFEVKWGKHKKGESRSFLNEQSETTTYQF